VQPLAEYQSQLDDDPDHHFPGVDHSVSGIRPRRLCVLRHCSRRCRRSSNFVGTTPLVFFIGRTHPRRASSTVAERRRMRHAASPKTHDHLRYCTVTPHRAAR
jgi:hypothetical protein